MVGHDQAVVDAGAQHRNLQRPQPALWPVDLVDGLHSALYLDRAFRNAAWQAGAQWRGREASGGELVRLVGVAAGALVLGNVRPSGQQGKPVFDTEGSWGVFSKMTDPDQQVAFVGRQYLLQIASQINRFYFFGWDYGNTGDLYNTSTGKLTLAGTAYQQIYQWTQGATPAAPCKASGTVWTCNFTRPNGYQAMAVWNSSQTCLNTLCTTLQFTVPIGYIQYRDLSGTLKTVTGSQIPVGLKPILFENKSAW